MVPVRWGTVTHSHSITSDPRLDTDIEQQWNASFFFGGWHGICYMYKMQNGKPEHDRYVHIV